MTGTLAARWFFQEGHRMQAIALEQLVTVTGGALSSSVSASISAVNTAVNDFKNASTYNNSSSSNLLLPVMMMAMQRKQQSVVSTPGATVVY
jgi:hypothetical protein